MQPSGSVADHPVGRLLHDAAQDRFSGTIQISGPTDATIHLARGFVVHVEVPGRDGRPVPPDAAKEQVHDLYAGRLAMLLDLGDGGFRCDPAAELPSEARWMFGPQGLLRTAAERAPWTGPAAPVADSRPPVADLRDEVRLDPDRPPQAVGHAAWQVVVAMARTVTPAQLAERLGWEPSQVDAALAELGASTTGDAPGWAPQRAGLPGGAAEPRTLTTRLVGPTVVDRPRSNGVAPAAPPASRPGWSAADGPAPDDDATDGAGAPMRASALRRLISSLR